MKYQKVLRESFHFMKTFEDFVAKVRGGEEAFGDPDVGVGGGGGMLIPNIDKKKNHFPHLILI